MPTRSRLAQLMAAATGGQIALALLWLFGRWSASPAQALAGAGLVLFFVPLVMALEVLLLAWVARSDSAPVPSAGELARAWAAEVRELFPVFYWRLPWRWREEPDAVDANSEGRTGVVLIHGFVCNRGFWAPWLQRLREDGRARIAVNLEPVFTSIDNYAPVVEAAVQVVTQATGRPPLLVCHSMGGLAARAWLRSAGEGAAGRVAGIVTIGTPHHGTWLARFSHLPNGRQMRRGSGWLRQLAADESSRPLPAFTCWYSHCDNIVFPTSTATLPDADNRLVPAAAHVDLAFRREVVDGTFALLATHDEPVGIC